MYITYILDIPLYTRFAKYFDETNCMSFLIENEELLEVYNKIWEKISNWMKQEFHSETVCDEKYWKINKYIFDGKINIHFHGNIMPKEGVHYVCLYTILTDSIFSINTNYFLQVFLEEC